MNNQFHADPIADAPRVLRKPYGKVALGAICGRQAGGWKAGNRRRSGEFGDVCGCVKLLPLHSSKLVLN